MFNLLEQKKLIFNSFVNRNWKKLTDSRIRDKILANNRKSHHPIETLGEVIVRKMFDNTTQANWNRQFGLLNKLVLLSD